MTKQYVQACSAYLDEYTKKETSSKGTLFGWYHYIDSPDFHTVGVVATAQMLILIKDSNICVPFDCTPMLQSLLDMQNPDGGWSYRSNILNSATEPTALSIQALLLWNEVLGEKAVPAIEKGISWLLKYMNTACLWGPIKKREKYGYIYFSCVVLRCLHRLLNFSQVGIKASLVSKVRPALESGCRSLLSAFNNNDTQCGWGATQNGRVTLFHTAYAILTLLEIDSEYAKKHPIIKSLAFLSDYIENPPLENAMRDRLNDGMNEIYQNKTNRLVYTHSVDVYILLALLYGYREKNKPTIIEKCKFYIDCAERTDWRYQGFVTCWRLYDIVSLCSSYDNLLGSGAVRSMKHFKIALTFAGESRDLVEKIAIVLADKFSKDEILYDKFHEADFARPQLDVYLQKLYHDCSDLIVVFLCDQYSQKRWCGVEWRAIRDILNNFNYEKIMYVKVSKENIDDITLPGFYGSQDGYIDANTHTPQEISDLIIERYMQTSPTATGVAK